MDQQIQKVGYHKWWFRYLFSLEWTPIYTTLIVHTENIFGTGVSSYTHFLAHQSTHKFRKGDTNFSYTYSRTSNSHFV